MKHKNNSTSRGILFKSTLLVLLLSVSFTSYSQTITTIAGESNGGFPISGYSGDGGPATAAELSLPSGVTVDASGNIYIADVGDNCIRKINTSGIISTFAGTYNNGNVGYSGDGGAATAAELNSPYGVAVDASGNVYIADLENNRVRVVSTSGIINTFAGNGSGGYSGDGGPATAAELHNPYDVAVDASGNVYMVDNVNNVIRKVNTSGIISTIAGNGTSGESGDGGQATNAMMSDPTGVNVDASGNVYIVDEGKSRVRIVNTSGIINTFAGNGKSGYTGDGGPATAAELNTPYGVTVDASGNVYISGSGNVRIVNTSGIINTIAGSNFQGYSGDGGPALAAELAKPEGLALDASGNIYIADYLNSDVREVTSSFSVLVGVVNVTCNGTNTGSLSATPYDASGPYTYSWSPGGATTSIVTGLYAGTYTVTLTENGGATATASAIITQPNAVRVTTTLTSPSCSVGSNGSASSTASNGTTPYTYSWSPSGGTKATASALSVGTYTITVTDKCGASTSASVTITQASIIASISATTPSCSGESNGTASVTASNSVSPYTYSWSPSGGTKSTATGLSAGTYTVTVSDKCGTTITASAAIAQGSTLTTIIPSVVTNVTCRGGSTGSMMVTVSDGTSPYSYSWKGGNISIFGATSSSLSGSTAATYTITVHDHCGTSVSATVTITQPNALTTTISAPPACYGSTTTATASPSGGTSPYTYSWSGGGGINSTASGLSAGTYSLTVQDNCGGTATAAVTITQPTVLTTGAALISNACYGISNGNAFASPSGGTAPYTYSWSNGSITNPTGAVLGGGTYTVTVRDNCGNTATASVIIKQSTAITATAFVGTAISCSGGSNGQAKVSVSGGKAPYNYSWSPITSSTYNALGLSIGTYTVTVTDNNGCNTTSAIALTQPTVLRDSLASITYPQCTGSTGSASIGVRGGTSPYKYIWTPDVSTVASAAGLSIRGYVVQVKDANGCFNNVNFSMTQPPALRDSIVKSATVNVSCVNGSATVGVKYGNTPYTYSWSGNGGSNATAAGLSAGTYTVTVSDGACSVTASVVITQPSTLLPTASVSAAITCYGSSTGKAKVSVSGGSSPYTYSWSPVSSSTSTTSGLSVGTYTITVSDKCSNSASSSVILTQPVVLFDSLASLSRPACGTATGSASIGVTGGTSPYRYTWTPNVSTTATATGLTARSYVVQVKDANGCFNNLTLAVSCSQPVTATYKEEASTPAVENINLYPNPNTGQFTISGLQTGMILEMYDYTGKKISSSTVINETMQLNINQANGVYLIRILDKEGTLITEKKVVKMQ